MKSSKNRTVGLVNNVNASTNSSTVTNTMLGPAPMKECANCGKRITERFLLKALDLFWHEDCLKCGCCDCRLGEVGSTLYTKANLILCKRDYLRLFGTTGYCSACNKVIPAFEMVMRAKNNVYHLECFACQQCNHRFCVGDRFYLCENKILCEYDYEERLVFANMAYNPSSLAHIRRQVSNLQPPATRDGILGSTTITSTIVAASTITTTITNNTTTINNATAITTTTSGDRRQINCPTNSTLVPSSISVHPQLSNNSNTNTNNNNSHSNGLQNQHRDDGSSGYGSPDSETFETNQT